MTGWRVAGKKGNSFEIDVKKSGKSKAGTLVFETKDAEGAMGALKQVADKVAKFKKEEKARITALEDEPDPDPDPDPEPEPTCKPEPEPEPMPEPEPEDDMDALAAELEKEAEKPKDPPDDLVKPKSFTGVKHDKKKVKITISVAGAI